MLLGIGLTLAGMLGASVANVFQAREEIRRYPLFALLTWAMAIGAVLDGLIAFVLTGAPVVETRTGYWLGLLTLPCSRRRSPSRFTFPSSGRSDRRKAAYSSAIVPIIAMGFSTWLEDYRWNVLTITGAILAIGGMIAALSRRNRRSPHGRG